MMNSNTQLSSATYIIPHNLFVLLLSFWPPARILLLSGQADKEREMSQ